MAHPFDIEVVAADRRLFTGDADSVIIPGEDGYFGVLAGHAPLVSSLKIGEITIIPPTGEEPIIIAVHGGFAQVNSEKVLILADSAELAHEIDIERAEKARQRAEERIMAPGENIDIERAQVALQRALNRLKVAHDKK
ncbi:MAG: F0F1 ATP synthase subunit epsilon [bacterium]